MQDIEKGIPNLTKIEVLVTVELILNWIGRCNARRNALNMEKKKYHGTKFKVTTIKETMLRDQSLQKEATYKRKPGYHQPNEESTHDPHPRHDRDEKKKQ
ncbi:12311_t:CDS:2 [Acaulospora colombiana]|uniref:12311_t:CDS:1 n=1 Tax=Acaulospora colombiana TaxID=27376 RepID=A0ACA9KKF4_9GLOM|nr:12311_t:CDS:2 [Acaulospora colombiana]